MSLFALYFCVALTLKSLGVADVFPSCLFSLITGWHCPGCGLTRAGIACLHGDLPSAWRLNPLIFVVVPAILFYGASDFRKFCRRSRGKTQAALMLAGD